jgi:hypothetical protein
MCKDLYKVSATIEDHPASFSSDWVEMKVGRSVQISDKSATPRISFGGRLIRDRASLSEGLEFVDNKIPGRNFGFAAGPAKDY